jgi:hypothetical protein
MLYLSAIVQQKNITEHINSQLAAFCQKFTQSFLATHSILKHSTNLFFQAAGFVSVLPVLCILSHILHVYCMY